MKKTLILFTFISLSFTVFGQWVNGTDKVTTTDRVGIGTTSTSNAITTITTSESTNILRLVNDGSGNESSIRLRSKNTSGSFLHADMAVYSTGSNTGYLGFKVPHNNTVNSGYDFIINHLGQMGLGTTSPSATFDAIKDQNNESIIRIVNSTAGTSASAGFKVNSQGNNVRLISFADAHSTNANENWLVSQAGGSSLVFGTQDLERMRINAHGNVGIGTNSPTGDGLTVVGGDSGQDFLTLERPNIGKFRFNSGGYSTRMTIGSNNVDRFTLGWDNSEAGFAISNDIEFSTHEHAFFIKNTGNVGIGTTDPDAKLTVKGNIKS
ncbi:MAG: hypothetical protein NXI20_19080, partial [bacterium]|nr:hypothetical protein [bacterium]